MRLTSWRRRQFCSLAFAVFTGLMLSGTAHGRLADLYQASVPVADQTEGERDAAIRLALEKVLVKVTGIRSVASRQQARGLVAEAPGLVQQYRYDIGSPNLDVVQAEGRMLSVRFDHTALQRALRERGLQPWTSNRPTVLLWLGIEQGEQRRFYQPEVDLDISTAIEQVRRDRGIEFLSPLMDLEDLHRLQAADLWGGFGSRVRDASVRYGADLVLTGTLSRGVAANWQLFHGADVEGWQNGADDVTELTISGLQETVDRIAARYAPIASYGRVDSVLVRVRGVRDLDGFVRVQSFLRSLDAVENVMPEQVEADQVLFSVRMDGGTAALARAVSLGGLLDTDGPQSQGGLESSLQSPARLPDLNFHLRE